ncbi:MAG: hypothetical protein EB127_15685 [Alphaproteobacteria bacterium]|nr:hypothetical protein [Alphaproteobacteria bacterium]
MGQGASNLGKKIGDSFNWLGGKIGEGWNSVKAWGNKAWNDIKSVPVIGKIAEGVEKYTPIGWTATNALRGIDAVATGGSKLLQGDVKGAISEGTRYGREALNARNPLIEAGKKIPGIGGLVSKAEDIATSIPVAGGMSIKDIRNIGNASLNAVDAFKEGDVKGGFNQALKAGAGYMGTRAGGVGQAGKLLQRIV